MLLSMQLLDANRDGKKDLVLAGNNSWARIKFGQFTGSKGTMIIGKGNGKFEYVPQWKSGLNIRGDVRSMQMISNKSQKSDQII